MDVDGAHGATGIRRRNWEISSSGRLRLQDQKSNKRAVDELAARNWALRELVAK